ncbi:MAG: hypothetical protein K2F98_08775, partial [Bacteroides sp.]|nr:hypothetical protein [Bacteroides sp.]
MNKILTLFFALFAMIVQVHTKTVHRKNMSDIQVNPESVVASHIPKNALIHLSEYRTCSYKVYIQEEGKEWQMVEVRNALVSSFSKHPQIWNDWENQKSLRDTMSYALFVCDFKEALKVRVQPDFQFKKVEIRPVSYGIEYKRVGDGIEFELRDASQKVSVEFDGNRAENLFLFPDLPDADKPDANVSEVVYYGAGQHD